MFMNPTQPAFNHIIAFDVAKETLAIHVLPGGLTHTIPNTAK